MTQSDILPPACRFALEERFRPELFKALCDPVRISIVAVLATRGAPATVSDLTKQHDIDYSGVSRHLKILRDAGVVLAEKQGREVFYSLRLDELSETLHGMADALTACGDNAPN